MKRRLIHLYQRLEECSRATQTPPEDMGSGALSSADTCPDAPCPDGPEEMAVTWGPVRWQPHSSRNSIK